MSGEIVREWYFWIISVATGAFMAFAYDVIRLFRRLIRHGRLAVDLEDILYWTVCFGISFTLLYYGNNGVIRFAAVLGAAVGMFVYIVTVGRFFVRISYLIIDKTVGGLYRLLLRLLRPIKRLFTKIVNRLKRLLASFFQKIRLTCASNHHKMKLHRQKQAENKKRRKANARKRKKDNKKRQQKDAGISSRQK